MSESISSFAGAEGFGAGTVGGRGGQVLHVTNLNDSGAGSLRWALEQVSGPRTVVFDVSGAITLKTQILIEKPNVTIAGQTAPGSGIVIEGSRIRVDASEVIVRGLHFRPGDDAVGMKYDDRDAFFIGSTDNVVNNVVIDHNSFEWSIDQNISATGRVQNITISNNIIAQGLSESLHSKGEHSKGAGSGAWTDPNPFANNHISYVKNLMADNTTRNPELGSGAAMEMINNYVYNWGLGHIGTMFGSTVSASTKIQVNAIGNVYEAGLDTQKSGKGPMYIALMGDGSAVYVDDNIVVGKATDAAGNQKQSLVYWTAAASAKYVVASTTFGSETAVLDSKDVAAYVLANAGASGPLGVRDTVDDRLIAGIVAKTSRIVDSVAEAGGKAAIVAAPLPHDTDGDGMPDWFETRYGFNAKVFDANGDGDRDGYTNLEEYINAFYSGVDVKGAAALAVHNAVAGAKDLIDLAASGLTHGVAIRGFDIAGGDKLALASLGLTVDPMSQPASAFVEVANFNGNTEVSVDRDGAGSAYGFEFLAEFVGVHGNYDPLAFIDWTVAAKTTPAATPAATIQTVSAPAVVLKELVGTAANDVVKGTDAAEHLVGLAGNDTLQGFGGNDRLEGGRGNDRLEGGLGNDILIGGPGKDTLTGGAGNDVFVFRTGDSGLDAAAIDVVTDFRPGEDHIAIEAIGDASSTFVFASAALRAGGYGAAAALAQSIAKQGTSEAIFVVDKQDGYLFWDTDGDRTTMEEAVVLKGLGVAGASHLGVNSLFVDYDLVA